MAKLFKTDGTVVEVSPKNGKDFSLKEMYDLIGNGCDMVQVVYLADGNLMWCDEEGKFNEAHKPNYPASHLLAQAGGIPGDIVMGHVLITAPDEVN
jgi:hypothetical protein